MTAATTSPMETINLALARIGHKTRITNIWDGSEASSTALDIYAQTRDSVLRQNDWGFAERNVALTLLKQAPAGGYVPPNSWSSAYPPLPWFYEYTYPSDCLKVRAVKAAPIFLPNIDPRPNVFGIENDNSYSPARKVLLCNVPDAVLVYTGQVTDPATWEPDFVEALAAALAKRLAPRLGEMNQGSDAATKFSIGDEAATMAVAEKEQG